MRAVAEVVLEVDAHLQALGIPHAFGGALALAYYAEPRGTVDVDVNVSVPFGERHHLLADFAGLGWTAAQPDGPPTAGVRLHQDGESVVIDVFFAFDPLHAGVIERAVTVPFLCEGVRHDLPVLSAEDLIIFKITIDRPRDWADIGAMADAGTPIDAEAVARRAVDFAGPSVHPRLARFRNLLESAAD